MSDLAVKQFVRLEIIKVMIDRGSILLEEFSDVRAVVDFIVGEDPELAPKEKSEGL